MHALERNLQFDAMEDRVSTRDESRDLPSFSVIRRIASEQRIRALAGRSGSGADASALEAEVVRLHRQTQDWERMAYDEEENAQRALEAQRQTKARLHQFAARIEALEEELRALGGQSRGSNPTSFDDLGEWAARNLSGRLIVTPKAERAAQRSTFEDIPHVYDCLYFLGTRYRDMKRGLVARDAFEDEIAALGIRITPTGRAVETAKFEGEYGVIWEGRRYKLNMHLAGSGSHDPRFGLRVYFAWDDEQQLVVVGHLPSHLTNSLT